MEIYLDGNRIRSLHDTTFSDLQRLEVINLSGNKLPALPVRLLERISSGGLKTLDLENNSVSLMPDGFFSSKPELPYVYLSYNPWLCGCSVGYLHSYLNDQDHNVYKHEGPNDIVPGADSVLCAGPPHLSGRPIIDLKEDDFCPPEPTSSVPLYPGGDQDFIHSEVEDPSDKDATTTHALSAQPTRWPSRSRAESWTYMWSELWTDVQTFRQKEAESTYLFSSKVIPTESSPLTSSEHFTEHSTADTIPMTQSTVSNSSRPQTTTLILDRAKPPTTAPITAGAGHETSTESTSAQPKATRSGPQRTDGADGRVAHVRMVPWCWWLFAGFVLLCLLSALTCCYLFLWLLKNYLVLYRRLQRYALSRSDSDGVTLRAYRCTKSTEPRGESMVTFLAPEQIKDTRAVFRSVLYISKEQRESLRDVQTEANGRLGRLSITASEPERAVTFRKTLYRVISEEQTHNRWTEEEERWDENTERRRDTRYSLILREHTGTETNIEWLMGEWEMGDGRNGSGL